MTEFMPLAPDVLAAIEPDDRFLVCFPRSGSRWMRLLLTDVVNQVAGLSAWPIYEEHLSNEFNQPAGQLPCIPQELVVPTAPRGLPNRRGAGSPWIEPLFRSHNISQIVARDSHPIVYLFRRPEASLVSYYYYCVDRFPEAVRDGTIDNFCLGRLADWRTHVLQAIRCFECRPGRTLFLQYQDHQPFDERQLAAACAFLKVNAAPVTIRAAIANLRRLLGRLNECWPLPNRRGANTEAATHISRDTLNAIRSGAGDEFDSAARIARTQLDGGGRGVRLRRAA